MIRSKQISDLESTIRDTSRLYSAGQGMEVVTLTPNVAGDVALNSLAGNKFYVEMSGDTQILMVENDRGQDLSILVFNKGGCVLTFDRKYRLLGDAPSTTPDDYILVNISFFGDGYPWVVINNQPQ